MTYRIGDIVCADFSRRLGPYSITHLGIIVDTQSGQRIKVLEWDVKYLKAGHERNKRGEAKPGYWNFEHDWTVIGTLCQVLNLWEWHEWLTLINKRGTEYYA